VWHWHVHRLCDVSNGLWRRSQPLQPIQSFQVLSKLRLGDRVKRMLLIKLC
jgi:hypothetical protein